MRKLMTIVSVTLSRESLILEDKMIIENCLTIIVGILLYAPEHYNDFLAFANADAKVKTASELVVTGLLCAEEKVRFDFKHSLLALATHLQQGAENGLDFTLKLLATNFVSIENRPSRQYFELFNCLIDLKAARDEIAGSLSAAEADA